MMHSEGVGSWPTPFCFVITGALRKGTMKDKAGRWGWFLALILSAALLPCSMAAADVAESRCDEFLAALRDGKYKDATAHFNSLMSAALDPDKLASTWQQLTAGHGKLLGWELSGRSRAAGNEVIVESLKFERESNLAAQIAVNSRTGEISGFYVIPAPSSLSYATGARFRSESVQVGNAPLLLPGILTIPAAGNGPWPAVVMLSGSGPQNKDETIGPNHPFRDIAEGLSSRGIVVLRYDKRTLLYAKQMDPRHTTVKEEYLDDAVAAVNLLRSRPEVAHDRIFVAGHSLGATIAPEVALKAAPVQGLILLAPGGRKLARTIVQQMRFLEEASHQQLDEIERKANELDNHQMPATENFMGVPASYYYDLDARDEVATARQLGVPILILHGGRDYQAIDEDIAHWQNGLKGAAHVKVETFPALNHLFIVGSGKPGPREYSTAGHVDEQVIAAMAAFIADPLSN